MTDAPLVTSIRVLRAQLLCEGFFPKAQMQDTATPNPIQGQKKKKRQRINSNPFSAFTVTLSHTSPALLRLPSRCTVPSSFVAPFSRCERTHNDTQPHAGLCSYWLAHFARCLSQSSVTSPLLLSSPWQKQTPHKSFYPLAKSHYKIQRKKVGKGKRADGWKVGWQQKKQKSSRMKDVQNCKIDVWIRGVGS